MFSNLLRVPSQGTLRTRGESAGTPTYLLRLSLGILLLLAAVEVALVGALAVAARLRRGRREEPREGFPWQEQPEIGLESGDARLKLYSGYPNLYEAMFEEIERAEHTIFIETFLWKDDEMGRRFVEALKHKAREGVEVYAIFDGVGNLDRSASFEQAPKGLHWLHYRPFLGPWSFLHPYNLVRSHHKLLAVDGRVAFLGGFGVEDLYRTGWRDTHVRIRGEVVREAEGAFVEFWNRHRTEELSEIFPTREKLIPNSDIVLRYNDPTLGLLPIRGMFVESIDRAESRIYLSSAYFVPIREIREGLMGAAQRGIDVQILLPRESTHALVDWFARCHFGSLLRAGVRIFEYDEHFVFHARSATIDGTWSTAGSANVDSLSLFGLHEINLEVHSERFAAQMEEAFELDKTNAEEVTLEDWKRRPMAAKLLERALAPLRPFS